MKRTLPVFALVILALVAVCSSSTGDAAERKKKSSSKQTRADPLYSLTLMRQGSVLMQQGQLELALESFREADRIAPGNATVHNMIGLCHLRMGSFDEALQSFNHSLRLIPDFIDARNNRGAAYLAMGQLHLAEVDFVAVLADPTYPHRKQVYYNLGMAYLQRGQLGAAEENLRRSIVQPNPVFNGYLRLAEVAQRQGKLEIARDVLEEARLLHPDRVAVLLDLGQLLILMGHEDEARPYLEQVIANEPGSNAAARAQTLLGPG
ncbi:MAG: tetratricopeptide repeat protein [Thermoanaerobaculales bacterium]